MFIRNVGLEKHRDIWTTKYFHKIVGCLRWKCLLKLWSIFTLIWGKGKLLKTIGHMNIFINAEQHRKQFLIPLLILLPSSPQPLILLLLQLLLLLILLILFLLLLLLLLILLLLIIIIILIIHIVLVKSSYYCLVFDN